MKRFFAFILLSILLSTGVMAQTRTRNVPFLPYAGAPMREDLTQQYNGSAQNSGSAIKTNGSDHRIVFFDRGSSEIREDQAKKIIQIGKWLEKEGGDFYTIRAFTSQEISQELAQKRVTAISGALADFRVGMPLVQYEYRKSPVLNPNRVEIYP